MTYYLDVLEANQTITISEVKDFIKQMILLLFFWVIIGSFMVLSFLKK